MVSKNRQKIDDGNGMLNLPMVPTQAMLRGSEGSLDSPGASQLFPFGIRGQGVALERVENGLKKSAKNRGSQW